MQKTFTASDVTIRDVPPTPVAIMEHRGDPATLGSTIKRFIAWRKAAGLHPKTHPTFSVWRSERRPASPADYSQDLCVGIDQPVEAHGEQIKAGEIPGGAEWLAPLAAVTLAQGGSRESSRRLWTELRDHTDMDWIRSSAERRLQQLDAMDVIDATIAELQREQVQDAEARAKAEAVLAEIRARENAAKHRR